MMGSFDELLWRAAFFLTAALLPGLVIGYLCFPARNRRKHMYEIMAQAEKAVNAAEGAKDAADALVNYRDATRRRIAELYHPKNYVLPVTFLGLACFVGFFVMFSRAYPLYPLLGVEELTARIPSVMFSGFAGGVLYSLSSLVTRYRSQDIPPALILQLGYQIILATGIAYFVAMPLIAFPAGFIPYGELTNWLRHSAQTRLGVASGTPDLRGGEDPQERRSGSDSLTELEGLSAVHRERLGEEGILTVENLALANPLSLYLVTSYSMPQIIDWIDQAYLRMYVAAPAAAKLAPMGILGVIEMKQLREYYFKDFPSEEGPLIETVANALGTTQAGARSLIYQISEDSQVRLLELMWGAFGGK